MVIVKVEAIVLTNNGRTAVLAPQDGTGNRTTMYRGPESRREFMEMFPPNGTVELDRVEAPHARDVCDAISKTGEYVEWHVLEQILQQATKPVN
jgi:hypothetical protein